MFILLNDGGVIGSETSTSWACCILSQRILLFELMSQNVACALLRGSEFRDSKVSTYLLRCRCFDHVVNCLDIIVHL